MKPLKFIWQRVILPLITGNQRQTLPGEVILETEKTSPLFGVNLNDIVKGLIVSVLSAGLTVISESVIDGKIVVDWNHIKTVSITAGVAYLLKNLATPSKQVLKMVILFMLISIGVNAQNNITVKAMQSWNADSTKVRDLAELDSAMGRKTGWLYYNNQSEKWRVGQVVPSDTVNTIRWNDLLGGGGGQTPLYFKNGLTKQADSTIVKLGGSLTDAITTLDYGSNTLSIGNGSSFGTIWTPSLFTISGGSGETYFNGSGILGSLGLTLDASPAAANITSLKKHLFTTNSTYSGLNVGSLAGNPSTLSNGDLWYNSSGNVLNARINGVTVPLGAGTTYTGSNGITLSGSDFRLGGSLTQTTDINTNTREWNIGQGDGLAVSRKGGAIWSLGDETINIGYYDPAGGGAEVTQSISSTGVYYNFFPSGDFTISSLSGAGTQMVVADINGTLATQAIPSLSPAGSNTQIQYNNSGSFGAESDFTYNQSTNTMTNATISYSQQGISTPSGMDFDALSNGASEHVRIGLNTNASPGAYLEFERVDAGTLIYIIRDLPTSSAGLPSGAIWNNGNVINIVP